MMMVSDFEEQWPPLKSEKRNCSKNSPAPSVSPGEYGGSECYADEAGDDRVVNIVLDLCKPVGDILLYSAWFRTN